MAADTRIKLGPDARLLVLTGAGASADSGIPTFRDANGLWNNHRVEDVASPEGFAADPSLVWRFYSQRRLGVLGAAPNAGHRVLAKVEAKLSDRFLLATQNVDGLHARAGSERVIELHGNLLKTRCSTCSRPPFVDAETYLGPPPLCDECQRANRKSLLRPHIVWFGEFLDSTHLERVARFMDAAGSRLIFVAIGTSGAVYPAAALVESATHAGGQTFLVNAEPAANTRRFQHFVRGRSADVLPALFGIDPD